MYNYRLKWKTTAFFKNTVVFYLKRRRLFLKGGDVFLQTWVQYKYSFVKALYRSFIKLGSLVSPVRNRLIPTCLMWTQHVFSSFTVSHKSVNQNQDGTLRETVKPVTGSSFHLKELYMIELCTCETVKAVFINYWDNNSKALFTLSSTTLIVW